MEVESTLAPCRAICDLRSSGRESDLCSRAPLPKLTNPKPRPWPKPMPKTSKPSLNSSSNPSQTDDVPAKMVDADDDDDGDCDGDESSTENQQKTKAKSEASCNAIKPCQHSPEEPIRIPAGSITLRKSELHALFDLQ